MTTFVVKSLEDGQLPATKDTLYTTPAATQTVVKRITLVNTHSSMLKVNLYFKASGGTSRRFIPKDTELAAGYLLVVDDEITLEAADIIEGSAGTASKVDYVISGVENS